MRRGVVAIVVLGLLAAGLWYSLSRPAAPTPTERVVRIALEGDVAGLDPTRIVEVFSQRVASQIFEGLVALDASNAVVPALAERWTPNDAADVWRFTLRRGVRFHPHDAFGAAKTRDLSPADVIYSFERMLAKEAATAGALTGIIQGAEAFRDGKAATVAGVVGVGESEVEIRLTRPDPYFVYRITAPTFAIMPREVVALGPDTFGRTAVIGTGPFVFAGRSGSDITLTRNPAWWGAALGNVDRVVFRTIREDQIRLTELRNGQVDMMHVPLALAKSVLADTSLQPGRAPTLQPELATGFAGTVYPTFNSYFVAFNTTRVDRRLRRAVAAAVNRAEIVAAVAGGLAHPAAGPVALSIAGWQPAQASVAPDPDRARQELAGLPSQKLEILVHELVSAEQIGEVVRSQLAPVGIDVTLTRLAFNAVLDRVLKGDYTATVLGFEYQYATPALILANHFAASAIPMPNLFYYRNPVVEERLGTLQTMKDQQASLGLAREIEGQIVDDAPAAFLFQTTQLAVIRRSIQGLAFNGHNVPLLWNAVVQ